MGSMGIASYISLLLVVIVLEELVPAELVLGRDSSTYDRDLPGFFFDLVLAGLALPMVAAFPLGFPTTPDKVRAL
jgi:hypothetical protein